MTQADPIVEDEEINWVAGRVHVWRCAPDVVGYGLGQALINGADMAIRYFTPVYTCERCGCVSHNRRVSHRRVYHRQRIGRDAMRLCLACWEPMRAHHAALAGTEANARLISQLKQEIIDVRKNHRLPPCATHAHTRRGARGAH